MTRERELEVEVARLKAAVGRHRDQPGEDKCWQDDLELYAACLDDGVVPDNRVGDPLEMLSNCVRFVRRRCAGGAWATYADLCREIGRLRGLVELHGGDPGAELPLPPVPPVADTPVHGGDPLDEIARDL